MSPRRRSRQPEGRCQRLCAGIDRSRRDYAGHRPQQHHRPRRDRAWRAGRFEIPAGRQLRRARGLRTDQQESRQSSSERAPLVATVDSLAGLRTIAFPEVERALAEPNGLLAAGADLSLTRLLEAYRNGIFPWFNDEPADPLVEPRSAHGPVPRRVEGLALAGAHDAQHTLRSARRYGFRRGDRRVAGSRGARQSGTWITRRNGRSLRRPASRRVSHTRWKPGSTANWSAACTASRWAAHSSASPCSAASPMPPRLRWSRWSGNCELWGFGMVDCQMNTAHLASFGAREIPRAEFTRRLRELIHYATGSGTVASGAH